MLCSRSLRHRSRGVSVKSWVQSSKILLPSCVNLPSPNDELLAPYCVGLASFQVCRDIWSQPTIREAWATYYEKLISESHTVQSGILREGARSSFRRDFAGLVQVSSRAEYNAAVRLLPLQVQILLGDPSFPPIDEIVEVFLHINQPVSIRTRSRNYILPYMTSTSDILRMNERFEKTGDPGRASISGTLHRIGILLNRAGSPIGFTIRLGKIVLGLARKIMKHTVGISGNLLIVAPPNSGKTTLLRDILLSLVSLNYDSFPTCVVLDTAGEITGDGDSVAPYFGPLRRLLVPTRSALESKIREAIQNHSPEILVVDEITTREEAEIICSACRRGMRVICTVHGSSLVSLVQNNQLNQLTGGVNAVLLSHEEKRIKNRKRKSALERTQPSPFQYVLQLPTMTSERPSILYEDVDKAVDAILESETCDANEVVHFAKEISLKALDLS